MRTVRHASALGRASTLASLVFCAALGLGACSRQARSPESESGSVGVALTVAPGITFSTASYTITGPGSFSRTASVDISKSAALTFITSGIPAASGYSIAVTTSGSGQACTGAAGFAVMAHATTNVVVKLSCHEPPHTGSVIFGGALNVCPQVRGLSATPGQAAVGKSIALEADWTDPDGGPMPLTFRWTAGSGTFDNAASPTTKFVCLSTGTVTLSLTVSDGDAAPGCPAVASVQVTCLDPLVAQCSFPMRPDGTACDDGNKCTQGDTCHAGVCTGGAPVTCTALDQCHTAGVCDPDSGVCSNPGKANGVACNDQNACTQSDTCQNGACVGASPVTCTALDQCHVAGTCNPMSGVCSNPAKANGTTCNDGNFCTSGDTCQSGACAGTAVSCAAGADACHPGVCNIANGTCSNPNACTLYGVGSVPSNLSDGVVGNNPLEDGIPNNRIGAFGSAIAYTGSGNKYIVTPDRGPNAGLDSFDERYYLVDLSLAGGVVTPSVTAGATLNKSAGVTFNGLSSLFDATNSPASRRFDSEGIRVTPAGTFWASDEYGPFLYEFSASGDRLRFITLPSKFLISNPQPGDNELPPANTSGRVVNRGMEGLAISPDGHRLYGLMQNGIMQDGELNASNQRVGTHNRIIEFDADSGTPLRELLYILDSKDYGCNELLAVNDHQFLAIERDGNAGAAAAFKRLMLIDITGATDISGMASLSPNTGTVPGVTPVSKQPFLDLLSPSFGLAGPSFPEKIEGLAFGPDQPDGRHVLVVTNDNDFLTTNSNNFYVFFVAQNALPAFQSQQATFSNLCANVTCPPPADGCHLQGWCNPGTGMCSSPPAAAGTPVGSQTAGDCQRLQCDGAGHVVSAADDTDVPSDGNQCTADSCSAGSPVFTPAAINTSCSQGGSFCDGAGMCVDCNTPTQCPGTDDECKTRTCAAHTCGTSYTASGQPISSQTAGDCHQLQCDGVGNPTSVVDNADVPVDGNQCTADVCTGGTASNPALPGGAACSGGVCDGAGMCTGCLIASDCPGTDTACAFRTCTAGACGTGFALAGTLAGSQTTGDCQKNVCDGAGEVTVANDDADPPAPAGQCQTTSCSAGTGVATPRAYGTDCTESGGQICDGANACIPQYLQILRADGTSSNAAAPLTLVKFTTTGVASPSSAVGLPSTGGNAITQSGSASSEGGIALSNNQKFLAVAGYNSDAGIGGVVAGASNRACVLLNASMTVTSMSKLTTAYSANNVRGAVAADDGGGCWTNGTGGGTTGGVWWIPANQTGGEVHVSATTLTNSRWLGVFGGQLYGSAGASPAFGAYTVGTGTPTTPGQPVTVLPGTATSGSGNPSSFGLVLFDRNSGVPGIDTLYLSDDRSVASGGGIQKWTFNGTTWTLAATYSAVNAGTSPVAFRGLTGVVLNGQVTLVATTTEASANRVVVFVDTGSGTPTGTVIATSPALSNYRGVALQPHN